MIETLRGYHETVNFREQAMFKLYHNHEAENYPPHWHSNPEIIMPLKGGYTVMASDRNYRLTKDDMIIISSGTVHQLSAPKKGERLILQPDFSLITAVPELSSAMTILSPIAIIKKSEDPATASHCRKLMLSIENEYFSGRPFSGPSIYSKFIELLVIVSRKYSTRTVSFDVSYDKQKEYTEKFINICEYINVHFADDLTLEKAATSAGFSKFHFARLFKQFTGKTFYRYVNMKRIENAEFLLVQPEITITEVAIRSGYSSLPSFARMFKLIKNCTPTEFKKMYEKK